MQTDLSNINFQPFPGIEGLEFCVLDIDLDRQILDAVYRFPANDKVALHRHVSQTNMLILSGELIIYEDDGSIRDRRKAGHYFVGKQDDIHTEGGGANGATVFYSVRGHGDPRAIELLDEDYNVIGVLTFEDVANQKRTTSNKSI